MTQSVRVGIIDSGINPSHPHVGNIAGGVEVTSGGSSASYMDRLGHGTAVAGVIHETAPNAELYAVKVMDRTLATNLGSILRAIDWCLIHGMDIINLSLGTVNAAHRAAFEAAVSRLHAAGTLMVSALEMDGQPAFPGSLPGVIGVVIAGDCQGSEYRLVERAGKSAFCASPFPRDIPGVPRSRNLQGISFAVARISAVVARHWPASRALEKIPGAYAMHGGLIAQQTQPFSR